MLKNILLIFTVMVTTVVAAQNSTASPYSLGGLGDVTFRGNAIDRMMGGLSVYADSIHANINNPASLGELKLTTFSVGVHYKNTQLSSVEAEENVTSSSMDYIAVSIPTKRFGFSFGIMPYSSVGYRLQSFEGLDDDTTSDVLNRFEGNGGLNRTFFSVGLPLFKGLNLGASFVYNFGTINTQASRQEEGIDFGTYIANRSALSGFHSQYSAHLKLPLGSKVSVDAYGSFSPEHNITSKNEQTYFTRSLTTQDLGSFQEVDLASRDLAEVNLTIGDELSYGISIGQNKKWLLGAQYTEVNSADFSNPFISINNIEYQDSSRLSVGGMFIPNYSSITSYWKRVAFRAGYRQEMSGILINDIPLDETGISFGVSLPLGGFYSANNVSGFSNFNIGVELGERGVNEAGLVRERFWTVRAGLSLNDLWFIKRQYN